MNRLGWAFLIFVSPVVAVEPTVRVTNDATNAAAMLSAPATNFKGVIALNPNTLTPFYSDGINWAGLVEESIVVYGTDGSKTDYPLGDTVVSRSDALEAAIAAMTNGQTVVMPRNGLRYEIDPINKIVDDANFLMSGEIKNKNANQDYLLRFQGDNNVIAGVRAFTDVSSGNGDVTRFVGDYNNLYDTVVSSTTGTSGLAYLEGTTARHNRIRNMTVKAAKGGVSLDGAFAHLESATFTDMTGTHAVTCPSEVEGGGVTLVDVKLSQDDDAAGTLDNYGGINVSVFGGATPGQFDYLILKDVQIDRTGTNASAVNLSLVKLAHIRNSLFDNVRIKANATTGGGIYEVALSSSSGTNGGAKDFDNIRFVNSTIDVPVAQSGNVDYVEFDNSFISHGNQNVIYWWIGSGTRTIKGFTAKNSRLESNQTGTAFLDLQSLTGQLTLTNLQYEDDSTSYLFKGPSGYDLNKVRIDNVESVNSSKYVSAQADHDILVAKKPGTYDIYTASGSAPPVPTSAYTVGSGARALSTAPGTLDDYWYNGSAWVAIAVGGGGGSDVVYKGNGIQSEANKINYYNLTSHIGAAPAVVAAGQYYVVDEEAKKIYGYFAKSDASAWQPIEGEVGNFTIYTDSANLPDPTTLEVGEVAIVIGDDVATNNGVYVATGAVGAVVGDAATTWSQDK